MSTDLCIALPLLDVGCWCPPAPPVLPCPPPVLAVPVLAVPRPPCAACCCAWPAVCPSLLLPAPRSARSLFAAVRWASSTAFSYLPAGSLSPPSSSSPASPPAPAPASTLASVRALLMYGCVSLQVPARDGGRPRLVQPLQDVGAHGKDPDPVRAQAAIPSWSCCVISCFPPPTLRCPPCRQLLTSPLPCPAQVRVQAAVPGAAEHEHHPAP